MISEFTSTLSLECCEKCGKVIFDKIPDNSILVDDNGVVKFQIDHSFDYTNDDSFDSWGEHCIAWEFEPNQPVSKSQIRSSCEVFLLHGESFIQICMTDIKL